MPVAPSDKDAIKYPQYRKVTKIRLSVNTAEAEKPI